MCRQLLKHCKNVLKLGLENTYEIFKGKEFKYYLKLNTKLIGVKENVHNLFH